MTTKFDSPALKDMSDDFPASWHRKVPSRIFMEKTITSELPFDRDRIRAIVGHEYDAYVNKYGALSAIVHEGKGGLLGLKPYEFTVIAWHETRNPNETPITG